MTDPSLPALKWQKAIGSIDATTKTLQYNSMITTYGHLW